jgi:hypothetical protein
MSLSLNPDTPCPSSTVTQPNTPHDILPNQTDHSTNHQGGSLNDISDPNSSIDGGTDINKCCNRYSKIDTDKDGDINNRMDIALGGNINDQNGAKKGGNEYNKVDIGNDTSVNSREDIDKDSGTSNNFGNNTYKLVFKGIKSQNWKCTINIPYCWNYKQLMVAVKPFRKTLRAKPNASL